MSGELRDLQERVKAASGPDRELDARLNCLANGWEYRKAINSQSGNPWVGNPVAYRTSDGDKPFHALARYTASLDAALALVERVLPGATFVFRKSEPGYWTREGRDFGQWGVILNDRPEGWTVAPTPALALLSALLSALAGEGKADEQ